MTDLTETEVTQWEADHWEVRQENEVCGRCLTGWPCPVVRLAQAWREMRAENERLEEEFLERPLIAGCIKVVAEINRKYGATSYADAVAAVDAIAAESAALAAKLAEAKRERYQWQQCAWWHQERGVKANRRAEVAEAKLATVTKEAEALSCGHHRSAWSDCVERCRECLKVYNLDAALVTACERIAALEEALRKVVPEYMSAASLGLSECELRRVRALLQPSGEGKRREGE